jgi:hypothetical protein
MQRPRAAAWCIGLWPAWQAVFALGYVGLAIVSWGFFFVAPVVTELLIAVCLAAAFIGLPRRQA